MSDHRSWPSESLSPSPGGDIVRICQEFESAWRAGQRPSLENFVAELSGGDRQLLLRELLRIELQIRGLAKESPRLSEYCNRFPENVQTVEAAFRAAPTMVGQPAHGLASTTLGGSQRPDSEELTRPEMPGFEVLDQLPLGGMGVVYRARQLEPERLVALKMIRSGIHAGAQELARFRLESEAIASLVHPHVVRIYDWGEWNGLPYLAMEFAEQGSLADLLSNGPFAPDQAASVLEQLARATQFIHEHEIIHRDLKPANVLLDREGIPKLADFGLAKRLDQDQGLTQTQAVLGTASYMAPEQAAGNVHALGPAVDVYALGAILFEMLTGRPPFRAETREQTIHQVLTQEPQRLTQIRAEIPLSLELICLKCLEKAPEDRFTSAGELAKQLNQFSRGDSLDFDGTILHNRRVRAARRAGFEILAGLEGGPDCATFRARDRSLGRDVVVEILTVGAPGQHHRRATLQARVAAAAKLNHANIVELYSFGELDGDLFIAREFVDGQPLSAAREGAVRLLEQAASDIEALARAVHHAHLQNIVHGNLKPTKILRDAKGACKIAGFGLGPRYAQDESHDAHHDLFCLGTILYEMLTGHPPDLNQLFQEERGTERRGSGLERELLAICQKCLQPDPAERYVNAAALAEDLRRARTGEVLLIDDLDEWSQQQRWARRAGYKILELLGQGESGFTYKAVQLANERLVVLKRISARFRFVPGMKEKFRYEARLLAGARHLNIAAFCEQGEQSDLVYFAREYVEGRSLSRLVDSIAVTKKPRQLEAARIVSSLARAVQHLHDKRIVHGGLHPGKIHVTSGGVPKITSLGRPRVKLSEGRPTFPEDEAVDIRSYLAPELKDGFQRRLERTVDIFALGAILNAMLSGKAPNLEVAQAGDLMANRSAGASSLEDICRRCLVKEPSERFSSAGKLADELESFFSGG